MRFDPNHNSSRAKGDRNFWPTPPGAVEALLSRVRFQGEIWEPADGAGHLSGVLEGHGYKVRKSDIITGTDFLTSTEMADNIVTNPPFNLATQFAMHATARAHKSVALLLRLAFLEGQKRREFFERTDFPLSRVLVFSNRIRMRQGEVGSSDGGMVPYAWFIWERKPAAPTIEWILADNEAPCVASDVGEEK